MLEMRKKDKKQKDNRNETIACVYIWRTYERQN